MTAPLKSLIIQRHLHGKSYAQIAKEIGVSKTAVFNVVQEWNHKVSATDIDAIRLFLTEVHRSGISVQDCIDGYRTCQILKAFEVRIEPQEYFEESQSEVIEPEDYTLESNQVEDASIKKELSIGATNQSTNQIKVNEKELKTNPTIEEFVNEVYNRCISYGIKPNIVIRWILDLFRTFSFKDDDETLVNMDIDMDINNFTTHSIERNGRKETEINEVTRELDYGIPYISQVTSFIQQNKLSIKKLDKVKKDLNHDIAELLTEKNNLANEISELTRNKNRVLSYYKWYEDLKKELYQRQSIVLNDYIGNMVNIINDFRIFEFNATRIINKYKEIESLITHRENIQSDINNKIQHKYNLERDINQLEESKNSFTQTINTFKELRKFGIGLEELKKLANVIYELAYYHDSDIESAFKKFMKDVVEQYDNKLGFEKIVVELEEKKKNLEEEIPEYKNYLRLKGIVAPMLIRLQNSGVTNEDIIGMNHLVSEFLNTDFLSNPLDIPSISLTDNNKQNRGSAWNLFISKLQNIKNINIEIQKRIADIDQLTKQMYELDRKKYQLELAYNSTVYNVNFLSSKLYQILDMVKIVNERAIPKPFVFLVFTNFGGSDRKGNNINKDSIK